MVEVRTSKTCGERFLDTKNKSYCWICSRNWYKELERHLKEADDLRRNVDCNRGAVRKWITGPKALWKYPRGTKGIA